MTPTNNKTETTSNNPSLLVTTQAQAEDRPQDDSVQQLARTLRRIKRRLLLEQCGVSPLPYALQSRPQALVRSSSNESTRSTIGVGISKTLLEPSSTMGRAGVPVSSEVSPAAPSME